MQISLKIIYMVSVRATHKSGLRALIAQGVIDFPAPGVDDPQKYLKKGKEFIEK